MDANASRLQRAIACALAAGLAWPAAPAWSQAAGPAAAGATAPSAAPAPAPAPARRAGSAAAGSQGIAARGQVTLNFVNSDIEALARVFSAMLNRPILVDPRVKGTISVTAAEPVTVREAYLTFLSALRGMGFAMIESGGLLKIVPEADARLQTTTVIADAATPRTGQVVTQIFTLKHENPNNLVPILRPLITANNTINVNPGTSALVITDYAENLQRLATIISALDQPSSTDFEIVPLEHAVAADVAVLVQRLADGAAVLTPGAPPSAGGTSVIADSRSNSLIIRAPNQARLQGLRAAIARLDRPTQGGGPGGNIWVVHLRNADAGKLATVLRAAFGSQAGASAGGNTAPRNNPAQVATPGVPGGGASTAATTPIAASAEPSTGGFVQADPSTNSLIITAPEPLYRQVRAMIDQLDTRRAQVYIEAMIVEVSGDNAADFGFQWQGLVGKSGDKTGLVAGTNFNAGGSANNNLLTITAAGAAGNAVQIGEGLNIGLIRNFAGTYALASIARLLQSQTATNIISTPNQVTLDNEEAKIVVGSNVPFITGQFTSTGTATTNPFQTIERKDVGITLRIKPQIGEGGTVRMTIFIESSSVSDKVAPGTTNAGPSTNKRQIESNVVVDDGGIIVLGGLIEDRFVESKSKVPLLGDIPYVGALFRSESRTKNRTNLMVFLRPVVLRDGVTADRLSLDRYDLIRAQQKDNQPSPSTVLPIQEAPVLPPLRPEPTPAPGRPAGPTP
ncbi:MAG: type II secretion system secretin GspD [Rubrivivax sp.]|nr:type II secretion system secretin GspD [Rubrivivax sp.]